MSSRDQIRSLLLVGDKRSVGRVAEVIDVVGGSSSCLRALVEFLCNDNSAVRMRATDALEKSPAIKPLLCKVTKATS